MSKLPQNPSVYRMSAEWEPHAATWLAWPHERTDWPGKFEPIPHLYAEIIRILSRRERVCILISEKRQARAKELLQTAGVWNANVEFVTADTNRSWTRDACPLFVKGPEGEIHAVKFRFNGWAKYGVWKKDDAAGEGVARLVANKNVAMPTWKDRRVVLEGGSIDVNGAGCLLSTEECLLSRVQERNAGLEREQYEALFDGYLGAGHVLWLKQGITGDDTHGHVDDLARFVDARTIVLATESDRTEANYAPLQENLEIARGFRDVAGKPIRVVELPMPKPVYYDGQRLPASYANFYIANGVVLVPVFQDANDRVALNILAKLFPAREVIGIYAVDLVLGLGTLHCMTMQQPA